MGSRAPYGSAPEGDAANEIRHGRDVYPGTLVDLPRGPSGPDLCFGGARAHVAIRMLPSVSLGTMSKQLFCAANWTSRSRPRAAIIRPTLLLSRQSMTSLLSCSIWAASAASLNS